MKLFACYFWLETCHLVFSLLIYGKAHMSPRTPKKRLIKQSLSVLIMVHVCV